MNRKITDNWLWDSYNKTKAKVKTSVIKTLFAHEKKVGGKFNTRSTSETEVILDGIILSVSEIYLLNTFMFL